MGEMLRWQTLHCACGGTQFIKVFELRRHGTGGLTEDPVGMRCAGCGTVADVSLMLKTMALAKRRAELEALQQELLADTPAPVTPKSSGA